VIWRFKLMLAVRPPDQQRWNIGNARSAYEQRLLGRAQTFVAMQTLGRKRLHCSLTCLHGGL
jgi:hypothetical protein